MVGELAQDTIVAQAWVLFVLGTHALLGKGLPAGATRCECHQCLLYKTIAGATPSDDPDYSVPRMSSPLTG